MHGPGVRPKRLAFVSHERQSRRHVPAMRPEAQKQFDDGMLEYIPGVDQHEDWQTDVSDELEEVDPEEQKLSEAEDDEPAGAKPAKKKKKKTAAQKGAMKKGSRERSTEKNPKAKPFN